MTFSRISFPAGFFDIPGADTPSAATPQRDDDTHTASTASQHPGSQDPTPAFDTPFPLHAVARERPSLSPLFIPPPFASNLARSRTAGTPDSGYHSAFTPASSHHFGAPRNTPSSPLQHRYPFYPSSVDLPPLCDVSDDEDDEDDNDDEPAAPNATQSDTARLLSLYKAGVVKAEVGENKIWKLQCNRCSIWVGTSVPQRIPLASAGQFRPLESHQSGKKCPYSPQFIRGSTAPPAPQTLPDEPMHVDSDSDEDDFQFQHGRSSSCPPEDTSARLQNPRLPSPPHASFLPSQDTQASSRASFLPSLENESTSSHCPGVPVDWNIETGPAGSTFPWHRVFDKGTSDVQTEFFRVEINAEGDIRAISKKCSREKPADETACGECTKIPARLLELQDLATNLKPHTNYRFLNYQQLTQTLNDKDSELRKMRTKCSNLARRLGNTIKKLADWRRLAFAVADSDYPRLTQLLSVGLRNGASARKLINMLSDAVEGVLKYTPRPSTDSRTIDIAQMTYILGGRKLLYALSHGLGLPSLRTIRNKMAFTRIMPTVGTINLGDILHNIEEVVLKPRAAAGRTKLRGVSLLIDETALEERAVHFRHNNQVGGLCWRHSPAGSLILNTYEAAMKLARQIKAGEVHLAKEMTVVTASCFGEAGTYPILALPACKHMDAGDSRTIYQMVTEAWGCSAASKVGQLWSWATDGDMTRRIAGYREFLSQKLTPMSPIYGTLASMVGLNLFTGANSVTLDFDFKHIFKRICTLLRSTQGVVLNNGRVINPAMLASYLVRLPGETPDSVHQMLFPHDPQDVPRAVELLQAVIAVGGLNYGTMTADTCADVDALRLLGHVIKSILVPFTDTTLSLTQQFISLSTFAHLSFSLFRVSRTQYMSNQLYGDSQTMVKNAIFCLAKQQILDPIERFYLFQVGDDPLERLFGKLRMLGRHNSAMNYSQAIDRLGHAADLHGAFMRNPDLDQGERRLNMNRSEGVDHLTMKAFTGDLVSSSCHLPSAWVDGRNLATDILKKSAIAPEQFDYATIFADEGTDMLAVFGKGLYPGIDTDKLDLDRSIIPEPELTPDANEDSDDDDAGDGVTFEEAIDPDAVPELQLPSGPGVVPNDYLLVDGKWVHKQRVCRLVISKDFQPKSITRLLRVRGHANVNARPRDDTHIDPDSLLGKDMFLVGDPILTLLRTDTKISVAVLRTTAIHQDGISRSRILNTTIKNSAAKVKITGQIYSLTLVRKTASLDSSPVPTSTTIRPNDWLESLDESDWAWIWNGDYLKVGSVMRGTSGNDKVTTDKVVLVSVPGCLTELVNPTMVDATIRLPETVAARINSLGQSWEIDDKQLGLVAELLWGRAVEHGMAAGSITAVHASTKFPYLFDDGNPALLSVVPTQQLTQDHGERVSRTCELCGEKLDNARAHMGLHILRKLRGVEEDLTKPVAHSLPCGFCGEMGHAACNVYVQVKKTSVAVESNCRLAAPFKYAFAERGSVATPCRNVPIVCVLCPSTLTSGRESRSQPAQWRYNMEEHLALAHPEYASPRNPDGLQRLPHAVWTAMEITVTEHRGLGIPEGKIPAPFSRVTGPDEGVEESQPGVRRVPVRTVADVSGRGRRKSSGGGVTKKRKINSGAPVASSSKN